MRTKCIIFGEALKIRGQKHKQNLRENCSKSTKRAFAVYVNFRKFSGKHAPGPLPESFLELKLFKINSGGRNYARKSNEIRCPFPDKKISEYAPDMRKFQRVYLRQFWGQNVLTSLYLG